MPRRKPYTKVKKSNQIRENHVKRMGDVTFKGFQCLNSKCTEFILVKKSEIGIDFEIKCPKCEYFHVSGNESKFYDYELLRLDQDKNPIETIETGEFTILHDDYINESQDYKYCIVCNTIKPVVLFDQHQSRNSSRQGECRLCKKVYNSIKNQTRISDQHREASQNRRLYSIISGSQKINSEEIFEKYKHKCFNCEKDLHKVESEKERPLDHSIPVYYLYPLTTETATLLCQECNSKKTNKWPSAFYSDQKLKQLSIQTGLSYELLSGEPQYNSDALEKLKTPKKVDELLNKYSRYIDRIIKLRNRILKDCDFDFLENSTAISQDWIDKANKEFNQS
ncbi:hypothetical protein [Crocosphaera sp. XPORK-15E]|uniref:hypothetical protein n=1 Tax=Crocosphaera sp. XPORK-15E TaxID=3110247 RepID=UPI002B2146D0|nr:hypothetical protein [Crocosphaera sp. XPORK-15E]MEA5533160.1 hypothetical protein [Crocosphaera sp. XPORK-15E]